MPVINPTIIETGGVLTPTELTMTASDTFTYVPGRGQMLILRNTTGGALTPTILGSTASAAIAVPGFGTVNASAGIAVGSIAAGAIRVIPLDSRSNFLAGVISITGGTGLLASLLS